MLSASRKAPSAPRRSPRRRRLKQNVFLLRDHSKCLAIASAEIRRRSNRWQRLVMVAGNFLCLRGRKDKLHMRGRLLQGLEQGVKSARAQHVHLVDHVDLVRSASRRVGGVVPQFTNVVDPVVARAVDFQDVQAAAFRDLLAGVAFAAQVRPSDLPRNSALWRGCARWKSCRYRADPRKDTPAQRVPTEMAFCRVLRNVLLTHDLPNVCGLYFRAKTR